MDNKNNDKEYTFSFIAKPDIEELVNEKKVTMDYEKEYKKMQSRYNKLLEENKKMQKALVNLSLKLK